MTYIVFYKFLFVIELVIAEFLYSFRLKKRKMYILRFIASLLVLFLVAAIPFPNNTFYFSCLNFFIIFSISLLSLWFIYDEPFISVLFCALASYTTQHLAYEFTNLTFSIVEQGVSPLLGMYSNAIIDFSSFDKTTLFAATLYLICYFIVYWIIYVVFAKQIKTGTDLRIKSKTLFALIGAGVLINIVISSVITYYLQEDSLGSAINYATNTLCGILLLASQFGQLSTKEAKRELDILQKLWHQEKEQYQVLQENMDLINIKCHDMRHKIRAITDGKNLTNEEISEIEQSIAIYDSSVKTGNEALDVILTEKGFRCNGKGIKFTCVVDGSSLSFLSESDIYSLFGNIMDNAIYATLKVKDPEERLINLKVHKANGFVSINIKNSYEGEITFGKDGLPITNNPDKNYHGFGMKSIAYIVDKYAGNLSIAVEDNIFNLNILFLRNDV